MSTQKLRLLLASCAKMIERGALAGALAAVPSLMRVSELRTPRPEAILHAVEDETNPAEGHAIEAMFASFSTIAAAERAVLAAAIVREAKAIRDSGDKVHAIAHGGLAGASFCLWWARIAETAALRTLAVLRSECPPECEDEQGNCYCPTCERVSDALGARLRWVPGGLDQRCDCPACSFRRVAAGDRIPGAPR